MSDFLIEPVSPASRSSSQAMPQPTRASAIGARNDDLTGVAVASRASAAVAPDGGASVPTDVRTDMVLAPRATPAVATDATLLAADGYSDVASRASPAGTARALSSASTGDRMGVAVDARAAPVVASNAATTKPTSDRLAADLASRVRPAVATNAAPSVADDDADAAVADWVRRVGERWAAQASRDATSANPASFYTTPAEVSDAVRAMPLIAAAAASVRRHDAGEAYAAEAEPEALAHRFDVVAPVEEIPSETADDGRSRHGRQDEEAAHEKTAHDGDSSTESEPHVDLTA